MSAKYDRQINIINLLIKGNRMTMLEISSDIGVCVHTVKRDIADLQYHFPIDTYPGKGGGVEMNKCFNLNGYMLKREQVVTIKHALENLACSKSGESADAEKLLKLLF